jgi:MFS family permease
MAQSATLVEARASRSLGLWGSAAVLCAVFVMAMLDRFIIGLLIPSIKAAFSVTDTRVSLLNGAAYGFSNAAALLAFGPLADRFNRRNLLLMALVVWSLATVASGFAETFGQLLAARIAVGASMAALGPAIFSMMADRYPPQIRGRAVTLVVSGGTVGAALSNFIGGALLQLFLAHPNLAVSLGRSPWQLVMIFCGVPGFMIAPFLLAVPEPPRQPSPGGEKMRLAPYVLKHRGVFFPLVAACGLFLLAGYAQAGWVPTLLLRCAHMRPVDVGLALGLTTVVGAGLVAAFGGSLSDRLMRRDPGGRVKLLAILLPINFAASFCLLATQQPALLLAGFAVAATAATMLSGLAATILPELAPSQGRGQITAAFELIAIICGMGLAPTLVALVTDQVLHNEAALPLSVVIVSTPCFLAAAALAWFALPRVRAFAKAEGINRVPDAASE